MAFIKQYWSVIAGQAAFLTYFVDQKTQLWVPPSSFKGPPGGTAQSALFVLAWNNLAELATAIGDSASAASYRQQAQKTSSAVNQLLWQPSKGKYKISPTDDGFNFLDCK